MVEVTVDELVARVHAAAPDNDLLGRVDTAVALASELAGQADALVDRIVGEARQAGLSWTEIGARLGISKQAARKRFPDRPPSAVPVLGPEVSLQPRLQACLAAAGRYAGDEGVEMGTEHLLAGLLTDGVAAAVLEQQGATLDGIRASSARLFPAAPAEATEGDVAGEMAGPVWSADAVCAVEGAAHFARRGDVDAVHVEVGTEHLLFAMAFDHGSRARRILADMGINLAAIKQGLSCYVTGNPRRRRTRRRGGPATATCSFCGIGETSVRRLVHGPNVRICATCVERAAQSLQHRHTA